MSMAARSFQISANNLNEGLGGFFRGLGFPIHVIANVVFHELCHETVHGSACGGEALKHVGARRVFVERAETGTLPCNLRRLVSNTNGPAAGDNLLKASVSCVTMCTSTAGDP